MIAINHTLISEDIFDKKFVCDLNACKGQCCVSGDSGAPLDAKELNRKFIGIEKEQKYYDTAMSRVCAF